MQQALDTARESEAIAKYLGGTDAKTKAGITGDVELASFEGNKLVLRLVGNFWHNRQVSARTEGVSTRACAYMYECACSCVLCICTCLEGGC